MKIENLQLFCLVTELGSISQAAKQMYLTQPTVTRKIHQLEEAYGVLLFDRNNGKLEISESGRTLYPIAKEIVNQYQYSQEALQQIAEKQNIHLNIGATLTIGEYFMPGLLGGFKKEHPGTQITMAIGNTPVTIEKLKLDEIDVAFVEGIVEDEELKIRKFADDHLILVCSMDHPWRELDEIDVQALSSERMIWREKTSGTRAIVTNVLKKHGVFENIVHYMELGSMQAIKGAVEANLGITILPVAAARREIKNQLLHPIQITGVEFKRELWSVRKVHRFEQEGVQQFLEFVRNQKNLNEWML